MRAYAIILTAALVALSLSCTEDNCTNPPSCTELSRGFTCKLTAAPTSLGSYPCGDASGAYRYAVIADWWTDKPEDVDSVAFLFPMRHQNWDVSDFDGLFCYPDESSYLRAPADSSYENHWICRTTLGEYYESGPPINMYAMTTLVVSGESEYAGWPVKAVVLLKGGAKTTDTAYVVVGDWTAPSAVADLGANPLSSNSVTLGWTAPGGDGGSGTAFRYEIRYSVSEITLSNWDEATIWAATPIPKRAGRSERCIITGLAETTGYYFALRSADAAQNWSELSNVAYAVTYHKPDYMPDRVITGEELEGGPFDWPDGIAVDGSGNFYVSDTFRNRIRKFTSEGTFVTQWGDSGSADGQFRYPGGVAVDGDDNVYVVDWGNHRVQKFTWGGDFILSWGEYGSEQGQFIDMGGIAADVSGNIWVVDSGNNRIQEFTADGSFVGMWGPGEGDASFVYPCAIAVNYAGNLFLSDRASGRILEFTPDGTFITGWFVGDGNWFEGVAVDGSGCIYAACGPIKKYSPEGELLTQWSGPCQYTRCIGVAVDAAGSAYATDINCPAVVKFVPVY